MVVVAEIVDDVSNKKPFLGGWRNTITKTLYWNAITQTNTDRRENCDKRNCILQTIDPVDASTSTHRDNAVQTCFVPNLEDRFMRVRDLFATRIVGSTVGLTNLPEETNRCCNVEASAIKIQRFYRVYCKKSSRKSTSFFKKNSLGEGIGFRADRSRPLEGINFERLDVPFSETKSEIDRLYRTLDRWRILEKERATDNLFRPSKIAICSLILSKEVELLRKINATKGVVKLKLREYQRRKFLDELSTVVCWRNSRGESILVETPIVQRAREIKDTYEILCKEDTTIAKRIETLSRIKKEIEPHTCVNSDEIIYLINQEIDFLTRGVERTKLTCLQNRQRLAFLLFAKSSLQTYLRNGVY